MKFDYGEYQELRFILESNINIYRLLLFLFRRPSKGVQYRMIQRLNMMKGLGKIFPKGIVLEDFFRHVNKENWEEIEQEYMRLFQGPSHVLVPPWESFYLDEKHLLFGESTYQIRGLLSKFGKAYKWKYRTPEDHLLVELEFVLYLLESALKALIDKEEVEDIYFEVYYTMITEHLLLWVPEFCQRIRKNSIFDLYIGASYLLEYFIIKEGKQIQMLFGQS